MNGQDEALLECDIVMKGGITSGVVYPRAATHLARRYRFRSVGGASAGAIAASFVAAAELGRSSGGFDELAKVPAEVGGSLVNLFQPSADTKPLYDVLMAGVTPGASRISKAWSAVRVLARSELRLAVVALVVSSAAGLAVAVLIDALVSNSLNWALIALMSLLWLPTAVVVTFALIGVKAARGSMAALTTNGFGICDGHTQSIAGQAPLCDWMTSKLNELAGLDAAAVPLTFGDLWGPQAVQKFNEQVPDGTGLLELPPRVQTWLRAARQIDLEVMTTNLTLRRPYRFPFETRQFFFCETCFAKYFPSNVVTHMVRSALPVDDFPIRWTDENGEHEKTIEMLCPLHRGTRVRHFPRPPDVPVVVAARISLSFPALISAVPLCYVDFGRVPEYRDIIVVWFSDGGIANNFPMDLFDTLWPTRPTFGIDLEPLDKEHGSEQTYLHTRGLPRSHDIASIPAFVQSLLDTMQNWVDTTQLTMSTYRNRVVEVRLTPTEGGMNLRMPNSVIQEIAALGDQAAARFDDFDLAAHQEKRFLTAMTLLDDLTAQLKDSEDHGFQPVVASSTARLRQAADDLLDLASKWATEDYPADSDKVPHPTPDLRLVPRQ